MFRYFPMKNITFELVKPEKSESSAETPKNWLANGAEFQRIKFSDLQDSILPRGNRYSKCEGVHPIFPTVNFSRENMSLFFYFRFVATIPRRELHFLLHCSSRWHSSAFFSRVTLISAVWSMFVRWKVTRVPPFTMCHADRYLWIPVTEFSEIKALVRWLLYV